MSFLAVSQGSLTTFAAIRNFGLDRRRWAFWFQPGQRFLDLLRCAMQTRDQTGVAGEIANRRTNRTRAGLEHFDLPANIIASGNELITPN